MTTERVAAEIRAELGRQNLSQAELAKRLNQHQTWVSRRLRGESDIKLGELEQIAAALDIPVSRLLADEQV